MRINYANRTYLVGSTVWTQPNSRELEVQMRANSLIFLHDNVVMLDQVSNSMSICCPSIVNLIMQGLYGVVLVELTITTTSDGGCISSSVPRRECVVLDADAVAFTAL